MDLRFKALCSLVGIFILTFGILSVLSFTVILGNYQELESAYVRGEMNLISNNIMGEIGTLQSNAPDWGAWDDTYAYVRGEMPDYPKINLVNATFRTLRTNFIIITNHEGKVIYGEGYDLVSDTPVPLRSDIRSELAQDRASNLTTGEAGGISGFLNLPEGPVILSSYPVLHSDYSGPVQGSVIVGRYVDDAEIHLLTEGTNMTLSIQPFASSPVSSPDRALLEGTGDASVIVHPLDEKMVEGRTLIRDIYGKDALLLSLQMNRDIYRQGRDTILFFITLLLGIILIAGVLTLFFLDRMVLSRMSTISTDITGISRHGDTSVRITVSGDDEISRLADATNRMLDQIGEKHTALLESEERYRILFDESPVSLWEEDLSDIRSWLDEKKEIGVTDFKTYFETHPEDVLSCIRMVNVTRINNTSMALFGAHSLQEFSESFSSIFTPESYDAFREELIAISRGKTWFEGEIPFHTVSGERKIALLKMLVVPGFEQTLGKVVIMFLDISERKKMEDALRQANKKITMLSSITRHDIQNQLLTLRGFLGISRMKTKDEELLRFLDKGDRAAEAIGNQIEFTKFYENIGVKAPEWQDILLIIQTARSQLPLPDTIEVVVDILPVHVFADGLIEKVFYNLLENTLRHGEHVSRIRISFHETAHGAEIVYEDNGVGISHEDKQHLFEKGFGKNTGLGLFLSREILSITGLTIQEEGEPGKGVRFVIAVPKDEYRLTQDQKPV